MAWPKVTWKWIYLLKTKLNVFMYCVYYNMKQEASYLNLHLVKYKMKETANWLLIQTDYTTVRDSTLGTCL